MNLANKITVFRVLLIPVFMAVLLTELFADPTRRYLALGIFIIASLTDMLDGYIARSRNMITNLGKFMDPLADKLLVAAAMIALVELGDLAAWVVILILSREFIVTGFRVVAASANIVIAAGWWGKVKTFTQMLMIIFLLLGITGGIFDIINGTLVTLAVIFTVISGYEYIAKNIQVLKE